MKKGLKIALSIVLMLSMLLAMTGCGEEKKAQKAFEDLMSSLKALDFEQAQQYMNLDEITIGEDESLTGDAKYFMENLFGKLEWEVLSATKIDNQTVQITANITALDMKPILGELFKKALEYAFENAFSSTPPSDAENEAKMNEFLTEIVSGADLTTVTTEVTVKVVQGENGWHVMPDEAFTDALLGGMNGAVSALENSFHAE